MQNELIQVPGLLGKAGLAIAALLAGAKFVLKQRVVLRADDSEVVAHCPVCRRARLRVLVGSSIMGLLSVNHRCATELRVVLLVVVVVSSARRRMASFSRCFVPRAALGPELAAHCDG